MECGGGGGGGGGGGDSFMTLVEEPKRKPSRCSPRVSGAGLWDSGMWLLGWAFEGKQAESRGSLQKSHVVHFLLTVVLCPMQE